MTCEPNDPRYGASLVADRWAGVVTCLGLDDLPRFFHGRKFET